MKIFGIEIPTGSNGFIPARRKIQPNQVLINNTEKSVGFDFSKMPETQEDFDKFLNVITQSIRESDKRFNDIDRSMDEITGVDYRPQTVQDWLTAVRSADQPWEGGYRSNWVKLFDIYFNMLQDTHVQGVVQTIKNSVQSKDFYIADETGNRNDALTEIFKDKWFYDFMEAVINSDLWGFGLIQLQDFDGESLKVREINRKHVRPDLGGIVKQQYDNTVFKTWKKEPFKTWTIYIFNNRLGKLNPSVRWYIYKTEIARIWAKFNQLYGVPPVIAKTKLADSKRRNNLINALKKWVTARWMVMDENDIIEPFNQSTSASGQQFFENLIKLADEQISKSLVGSTMVLDDGSSRSQSEVHEANLDKFINSICRLIKFTVDKELIHRMRKIGFQVPENIKFIWDDSEKLTMKERAEVINLISLNYNVDVAVASEFIGIELEEKEDPPEMPVVPNKKELENIYKQRHGKD